MFLSPGRTGAGIASVLGNTQPLFAVVLAALFLGERVTRGKLIALALGLAGVTLIAYPVLAGADAYGLSGALLALGAAGGTAAGTIIVKRAGLDRDVLGSAAWQLILGSLPLLAVSALVERDARVNWTGAFLGLLLFLALVGTSFATALWYWLLRREEVGRLTMFLFLVPLAGLGIAALVFGEQIGLVEALGALLTVAGIFATLREPHTGPLRSG